MLVTASKMEVLHSQGTVAEVRRKLVTVNTSKVAVISRPTIKMVAAHKFTIRITRDLDLREHLSVTIVGGKDISQLSVQMVPMLEQLIWNWTRMKMQ